MPIQPTIYFDVSDLLHYLRGNTAVSGIQRVQCEIIRNMSDVGQMEQVRFVVLDEAGAPSLIDTAALLDFIEHVRSDTVARAELDDRLDALFNRVTPSFIRPHDIFLTIGAFWSVRGVGPLLQALKNSGVIIGIYIHDIFNITDPDYFKGRDSRIFIKSFVEAVTFADIILTTSEFNKASLIKHMASRNLQPLPVHVVPLAQELSIPAIDGNVSSIVADIANSEFVLCVGTIEVRKNPTYLFNIWKLMIRSGRTAIPRLVFVGRSGWLVQDLMEQLEACNYLDGKIVILHDVTDVELALLYRRCLLTMFPSWAEGWGLPVGESLAHGKICITSKAGAVPEVAGELADYLDPYNARDGLEVLLRYLDDPELRRRREREIAHHFKPRSWRKVAENFLNSAQVLADQIQPFEGVAAIKLPPNTYLRISSDAAAMPLNAMNGELSADLICISGWQQPEIWGVRAKEPVTVLRFRGHAPAGTRIYLIMHLISACSDLLRIRISSGSGAETEVSLEGWSDKLAVLPCAVEPDDLVSVCMSMVGSGAGASEDAAVRYWGLNGILYFEPERLGGEVLKHLTNSHSPRQTRRLVPATLGGQPDLSERFAHRDRVPLIPAAPLDNKHCAASLDAFLHSADSYWRPPRLSTSYCDAPIFADHEDRQIFYNGLGCKIGMVTDHVTLIRRSDQFVSMSRFTEGSVFDRSGVSRAFGYLEKPSSPIAWLSGEAGRIWTSEKWLAAAPFYDKSYAVFYNGNLHNYYHWMTEGILSLDILSRGMGPNSDLHIALPKSMDINAVFDHRESLRAMGLDQYPIFEVEANLIKVREAIWVESDLLESMPASSLKDFQRRVAARYAGLGRRRNRRLLVARRGSTRKIHNIKQVEAFLSKYNFETVYLEGMKVTDQIMLFQSAEFVIGVHGAGLANLLFCEPGTKVIEFMPFVEMRPFMWLISEKLDLVHGMQFCVAAGGQGFQAAVDVDIGKLQALYRMVDAHC